MDKLQRVLVAIESCSKYKQRRDWQRETWLPELKFDYKFFIGNDKVESVEENVVALNCKDDYNSLPEKTLAIIKWARENEYNWLFKIDDDVYCKPDRLHIPNADYVGHAYGHPNYCSGAAYWLSSTAMDAVISNWTRRSNAEDSCVGQSLEFAGIKLTEDPRYKVGWKSFPTDDFENEFPHPSNNHITFHLYFPHNMPLMHSRWDTHIQYVLPPKGEVVIL